MGNYSYLQDQEGCVIDEDKLRLLCALEDDANEVFQGALESLKQKGEENGIKNSLGVAIDGWKIQGYWYKGFCKFIWLCCQCMITLTDERSDNCVSMEEEQGFKFTFYFFLDAETKKPKVEVDFMPMDWHTMEITENGGTVG